MGKSAGLGWEISLPGVISGQSAPRELGKEGRRLPGSEIQASPVLEG